MSAPFGAHVVPDASKTELINNFRRPPSQAVIKHGALAGIAAKVVESRGGERVLLAVELDQQIFVEIDRSAIELR